MLKQRPRSVRPRRRRPSAWSSGRLHASTSTPSASSATPPMAEMLNWLVNEQGIEPHIPVFDKSQHTDGTFSREDFAYDPKRDCYICPAGKELKRRPRRIPPRRHRPKPPQARHADPNANADLSNLRRRAAHEHGRDRRSPPPQYFKTDFFNGIGQTRKLPLANMGYRLAPISDLPRRRLTWPVSTRRVLVHLPHAAPLGCHPGLIDFISLLIRFQRTSIGTPSKASQRGA